MVSSPSSQPPPLLGRRSVVPADSTNNDAGNGSNNYLIKVGASINH